MKAKHLWFITIIVICAISTSAYAGWNFGLGTGPTLMAIDGDVGFDSTLAGGPVDMNLDLDASDMSDLIDSAFGFSSYATDGKWMFQLSLAQLNLEGDGFTRDPNIWGHVEFDVTVFELTAGYPIYKNNGLQLNLLGGVRYTKHELKRTLHVGALEQGREVDNNWTDGVIGLSLDVPIYTNWSWNTNLNAGYGGSEGCYTVNTGVTWRFYKGWSGTLFYKYAANDFEEGDRGSADWYLYDVDEQYFGLAILYNW